MKVAVLLLLVVLASVSQSDARWWRRAVRRVGSAVRRVIDSRVGRIVIRIIRRIPIGKRDVSLDDMNEEELAHMFAARDLSELVDVNELSESELADLKAIQLEARDFLDEDIVDSSSE